jgi:putative transposase
VLSPTTPINYQITKNIIFIRVFLDGYSFFITIITYKRQPLLIDNFELLRKSFALSKKKYAYNIGAIIVLPDHLHMIITPKNANDYPKIVTHIQKEFCVWFGAII